MTESADPRRWQPSPHVVAQQLGDDTVLVHLESDRIFELNATASRLWRLLESGHTLAEAKTELLKGFEVEEAELNEELRRTLETFVQERMVLPRDA